jgi:hypothetical protein
MVVVPAGSFVMGSTEESNPCSAPEAVSRGGRIRKAGL